MQVIQCLLHTNKNLSSHEFAGGTTEFYYYYNSFENLAGIKYYVDGTRYMVYAICNTRGDVEDLYWGSGSLACHYTYDSWGNVISVTDANGKAITDKNHIGHLNPFRYRGYYYDSETGYYYLQSRYYNPQVGRFLNADSIVDNRGLITQNLFQYCGSNPINCSDTNGHFFNVLLVVGIVVGAALLLNGCSSKNPSSTVSTTSGTTKRPQPSTTPSITPLTKEQKHFVSVVAGEAIGSNTKTQKAVAHTIMNRVNEPRDVWCNAKNVTEVLTAAQYNAVGSNQYNLCLTYLNNRDGSNAQYEGLIAAVIPIYNGEEADFTGGAHYIFNVKGSAALLKDLEAQPDRYVKCGPFDGISDVDYRMYRCIW